MFSCKLYLTSGVTPFLFKIEILNMNSVLWKEGLIHGSNALSQICCAIRTLFFIMLYIECFAHSGMGSFIFHESMGKCFLPFLIFYLTVGRPLSHSILFVAGSGISRNCSFKQYLQVFWIFYVTMLDGNCHDASISFFVNGRRCFQVHVHFILFLFL